MKKTVCFALAALLAASASAQQAAQPHPADPKAGGSMRPYESSLRDYRPYVEPEVGRWREANQDAGRLGGHAGHTRKETEAAKPAGKAPAKGHDHHGGSK